MYWRHQALLDVVLAALVTVLLWQLPRWGSPPLFVANAETLVMAARTWVGPLLTLLGMMSATTAFVFSVVERGEFAILRKSAESQLWRVFSENLLWLGIAAIAAVLITFSNAAKSHVSLYAGTFLVVIVAICVMKFVWVMRQIVSVRIAHAERRRD